MIYIVECRCKDHGIHSYILFSTLEKANKHLIKKAELSTNSILNLESGILYIPEAKLSWVRRVESVE